MGAYFLDTSAWAKAYVREAEHQQVVSLLADAELLVVSSLAYVEIYSAISRAIVAGRLAPEMGNEVVHFLERDWSGFVRIPADDSLVDIAAKLAFRFRLRGYDSMHLATAVNVQNIFGMPVTFAVFDQEMRKVARTLEIPLWPTE